VFHTNLTNGLRTRTQKKIQTTFNSHFLKENSKEIVIKHVGEEKSHTGHTPLYHRVQITVNGREITSHTYAKRLEINFEHARYFNYFNFNNLNVRCCFQTRHV
jgi:hypothetical protein